MLRLSKAVRSRRGRCKLVLCVGREPKISLAETASALNPSASPALADLYRRHWAELCRYVGHRFGAGPPEPEDVTQAAFAQFAALANPGEIENPRAFLFRTAHNIAIHQLRRQSTSKRFARDTLVATSDEMDGHRVLEGKERFQIIEATIRAMDEKRRHMLILNRIHGLSYAEIARRTGVSQTHVKRLIAEAVVKCHAALRRAEGGAP